MIRARINAPTGAGIARFIGHYLNGLDTSVVSIIVRHPEMREQWQRATNAKVITLHEWLHHTPPNQDFLIFTEMPPHNRRSLIQGLHAMDNPVVLVNWPEVEPL